MTVTNLNVHEIETLEQLLDNFTIKKSDVADVIRDVHGEQIFNAYTTETTAESVTDVSDIPDIEAIALAEDTGTIGSIDDLILEILEREDEEYVHITLTSIYAFNTEEIDSALPDLELVEEMKKHAGTEDGVVRVAKVDTADPTTATTTREQLIVALNRHKRTRPDEDDLARLTNLQRDLEDRAGTTAVELESVYSV